jgi:CubicO group peptidase (beta-lactamase class C family)
VYEPPLEREDGWSVATVEEVNIDRRGIESFIQRILDAPMDSVDAPQVHGVLIARHGKLVVEEYFHGFDREALHDTRSASKSLSATLVGAALHEGAQLQLSSSVYEVMNGGAFPEGLEPNKRKMTLENLLTMSSGFFCDDGNPAAPGNEDVLLEQREEPDYYRYSLNVPLDRVPGERAVYCSADPNLALGMLARATGEHLMDVFDRLIAGPLQIDRHAWFVSPALQPYGGGGVRMRPRDFMKIGQLMLDGGKWRGHRILDADFVKRASAPLYDLNQIKYGYLWWSIAYPYKDRTVRAYFAGGNGGQGVIVIPELDLIVATFAGNYASRVGLEIQQGYTPRYILPAVRERGDDENAPVVPQEFTLTYGRSPPPR